MIKKLRFIFPLFIVLLSGYIQHGGHGYSESLFLSAIKDFQGSVFSSCVGLPMPEGCFVNPIPSASDNSSLKNHATAIEEKDEELVAFRRYLEFSTEFYTTFYTEVPAGFRHFIGNRLFFSKNFSYFPSYKALYILLKVIRI